MLTLPEGVQPYRRTPTFTQDTIPDGLRGPHNTKAGVWGVIHVLEGELLYRVLDPEAAEEVLLSPGREGVVVPEQRHQVEPQGPVSFYVEFHAAPSAA